MTPKFLKNMDFVTLPDKETDRVAMLTDMLGRGVVKFTSTSKAGTLFERTVSNKVQVLERMLGKDYVKNFESIRNKLYHVREMLKKAEVTNRLDLEKVGVEYNLLDHVNPADFFSDAIDKGDTSPALLAVNEAIQALIAKSSNRQIAPNALLYRDVHAADPKDFFGNVNVNNIIAVEFSEA
jgi:hypothetical protein